MNSTPLTSSWTSTAAASTVPQLPLPSTSTSTPTTRPTSPSAHASNFSEVRFREYVERGEISEQVASGVPFEFCTHVQAATLSIILSGVDVLARAKTGTGKTIAFLLPIIQQLSAVFSPKSAVHGIGRPRSSIPSPQEISALILTPTRELAQQIQKEAERLISGAGLKSTIGVQCVVGGTNVKADTRNLSKGRNDILVATPGRLIDLMENYGLQNKFSTISFLVLDEADRLLDAGFKRDLERIMQSLPNRHQSPRQTLFFSATIPPDVQKIAEMALLPNHQNISTLTEADTATHQHVDQRYAIVPQPEVFPALGSMLDAWLKEDPNAKIMVFACTARATGLMSTIVSLLSYLMFEELNPRFSVPHFAIHSRLSQNARTRATDNFRKAKSAVLFTSDVTARGIDVPGVTHVVQVGLPSSTEQYVHRLGRTGRAGETGKGVLLLSGFESYFVKRKELTDLGLEVYPLNINSNEQEIWRTKIKTAIDRVDSTAKEQAYQAWLGFYKTFMKSLQWTPEQLVSEANKYAVEVLQYKGADAERKDGFVVEGASGWRPPPLAAKTVGMMQLRGVPGLNVVKGKPLSGDARRQGQPGIDRGQSGVSHGQNSSNPSARGGHSSSQRGRRPH
ncbi:P-loop containing nucleoside triphosphate hydrolase protein [Hysterangium stoloniferum]|nr:P-loop containing nucleoside triphosphate hydrolase protein [Hysterangium stoloniferum]